MVVKFLYCRCLIVVLHAGFDETARHLSMSSTPFRHYSVSGNIPKFYSILPLIRYTYQRFSLKMFLLFFILWDFLPGGDAMPTTLAFWHNTTPYGHCPILFTGIVLLFRNLGVFVASRYPVGCFHELIWFLGGLSVPPLFETSFYSEDVGSGESISSIL